MTTPRTGRASSPRRCGTGSRRPAWMLVRTRIAPHETAWIRARRSAASSLLRLGGGDASRIPVQACREVVPIEARTRIDLASGRDMLMPDDVADPTNGVDGRQQFLERGVLRGLEGVAFETLELDADGPV